MTFTVDYATTRGQVRLTIADVDPAKPIFDDDQIDAFLALEASNTDRASARALETIARSELLTQKVIRLMDLSVDGRAVAAELRLQAKQLRELADANGDFDGLLDWAELVPNDFAARERLLNQRLRSVI